MYVGNECPNMISLFLSLSLSLSLSLYIPFIYRFIYRYENVRFEQNDYNATNIDNFKYSMLTMHVSE